MVDGFPLCVQAFGKLLYNNSKSDKTNIKPADISINPLGNLDNGIVTARLSIQAIIML